MSLDEEKYVNRLAWDILLYCPKEPTKAHSFLKERIRQELRCIRKDADALAVKSMEKEIIDETERGAEAPIVGKLQQRPRGSV